MNYFNARINLNENLKNKKMKNVQAHDACDFSVKNEKQIIEKNFIKWLKNNNWVIF